MTMQTTLIAGVSTPAEAPSWRLELTETVRLALPIALTQLASGLVVAAEGPDTVIAAPDGRLACAQRASSWLSVAGTGDVLAGAIASRLATGLDPFDAACQGVWLHSEAARLAGPAFTAGALARAVPEALAACL